MELGITGATFRIIATDGGPLERPYVTDRLLLPVGARYDLEVTYDGSGQVTLDNWRDSGWRRSWQSAASG